MTITIDWGNTNVIYVPKADLSLIQADPEIREIDLDWFRLELKNLEDSENGMIFPDTHEHNTEVTLAGLTFARIVEILAPYTVEFEDGQYTVNCTGANHNLSDVKVANQVSLIVNNAAGLINNPAIEYSSFNGGVTIDVVNGVPGTVYNIGTPQNPGNNVPDVLLIVSYRGFGRLYVRNDLTVSTGTDVRDLEIVGESKTKSTITIDPNSLSDGLEIYEAAVTGTLDGDVRLQFCLLKTLNYVNGFIIQCGLSDVVITLGGSEDSHFVNCWSEVAGLETPEINMGGSGRDLGLRGYMGGIKISNLTGNNRASLDFVSGQAIIDSTCTAGTIVIRGADEVEDNSGSGCNVVIQSQIDEFADAIWEHSDAEFLLRVINNKKALEKTGSIWELIIYDDDNTTPILQKALKDKDGNNITDLEAGTLAMELKTSL